MINMKMKNETSFPKQIIIFHFANGKILRTFLAHKNEKVADKFKTEKTIVRTGKPIIYKHWKWARKKESFHILCLPMNDFYCRKVCIEIESDGNYQDRLFICRERIMFELAKCVQLKMCVWRYIKIATI